MTEMITFSFIDDKVIKRFQAKVPKNARLRSKIVSELILGFVEGKFKIDLKVG